MSKAPETRDYNFSDAELVRKCNTCAANVRRDITDFNTRGVTTVTVDDFETLTNTFNDLPTDDELLGIQTTATEAKDLAADALRSEIRMIRGIAFDKYKGKGRYRSFGFDGMDAMSDDNLYRLGGRVYRVGTTLQADLLAGGLTTPMLTTLKTNTDAFNGLINTDHTAQENRDLGEQDRVQAGNTLYAELVRLCGIGKYLYQDTNEAKYNDYIVVDAPPPPPPPAK